MEIAAGEIAVAFYYLTLAAVLALAATKGGRFARGLALTISTASIANFVTQFLCKQLVPIIPFSVIDLAVFGSVVRIWWRYRRIHTGSVVTLQIFALLIDALCIFGISPSNRSYMAIMNLIYYAILGAIAFGIVRRRIGPPLPIPLPTTNHLIQRQPNDKPSMVA